MRGVNGILAAALVAIIAAGFWLIDKKPATTSNAPAPQVNFVGDLRLLAKGELKGRAQLADLTKSPGIYGIGMLDGLATEVLVLNSKALVSKADNNKFVTSEAATGNVAFGIYAQVPEWREVALPDQITSFDQLQDFVPKAAADGGLDASKPIPVRIVAEAQTLNWFIVNGTGNGKPDLREAFFRRVFKGGLDDVKFEAFGLFSKSHRGIYTNATSNLHMHFKTEKPDVFVAHLDNALTLKPGGKLYLPFKDATLSGMADAINEPKAASDKPADAKTSDTKAGDTKAGDMKTGEKTAGEIKAGDTKPVEMKTDIKPADTTAPDAKADAKPADVKPVDAKSADVKSETAPADAKVGDAKPAGADAKPAPDDAKPAAGSSDAKPTDVKSSDAMKPAESPPAASEAKPGAVDAKPAAADAKPVDVKPADIKPGDMKLAPAPDAPGAVKPEAK